MARPLSFHQIQAFRAVLLSGTTVAAARMLHTTQPSISRLIAQAQSATGLKLFVNDRGRLHPTREALHLFDTVQLHFQGMEKIEQTVSALRESGAGLFRIACTPTLALGVLPKVMDVFTKAWPNVHTSVETLVTRQIREGLLHGRYDIAITNNALGSSEFVSHEAHAAEAVCVMAAEHPCARRDAIDVAELGQHTLLCLDRDNAIETEVRQLLAQRALSMPRTIQTTYAATICAFAAQGLGLGVVNPYIASVFKDRLAILRFTPAIKVTTFVSFSRFTPASELAGRFFAVLNEQLQNAEWTPGLRAGAESLAAARSCEP